MTMLPGVNLDVNNVGKSNVLKFYSRLDLAGNTGQDVLYLPGATGKVNDALQRIFLAIFR